MSRPIFRPRVEGLEDRLAPAAFTVTTAKNSGAGSLRAAIASANSTPGADTIDFNITGTGTHKISLLAALPKITETVTIDATTQPGFTDTPLVLLNGSKAPGSGLVISTGADGSVIKGLIIQRFTGNGISLRSNGNTVESCFIGTNATGSAAPGNGANGIAMIDSSGNTIGGDGVAQNLISGNHQAGVLIQGAAATANVVAGDFIGTNNDGTIALPNFQDGVKINQGANGNTVGDVNVVIPTFIAGNDRHGVFISGVGTDGNTVAFTSIGSNLGNGIMIQNGASNNTIGGATTDEGNVIAANFGNGVVITGTGTSGNTLLANFIGTDVNGTTAVGNGRNGVTISAGASSNTIGSTLAGLGNLISANGRNGINITGTSTTGNLVAGNLIGTEVTGTNALGNGFSGVQIATGAANNTVGGTTADALNVISGNIKHGVLLTGSGVTGNTVLGNMIGTDVAGSAAIANGKDGVQIATGAKANTIGGSGVGEGNTISGNGRMGVLVQAKQNTIKGNKIGTSSDGSTAIGNGSHGVFITNKTLDTLVGGINAGEGNVIANNGRFGVLIGSDPANGFPTPAKNGNAVLGNSIFANALLGISLNHGANNKQNFPTINTATIVNAGTQLDVNFQLVSTPNTSFRVEIFASTVADPLGFGEGETFLGFVDVTTDGTGTVTTTATVDYDGSAGTFITATATNSITNDTSGFSAAVTAS